VLSCGSEETSKAPVLTTQTHDIDVGTMPDFVGFELDYLGDQTGISYDLWEQIGQQTWERVSSGDEWGTGWIFPEEGCWRFEVSRDDSLIATLVIAVTS